ncbi:MAG: ABC transporter ATP-binding protein [Anaerolineae bacterium]|nr:ABC transporter ATP-binding protein [Anaerolineae bacterium]
MTYDRDHVVLSVRDLSVTYKAERGLVQAVSHASFDLHAGETLALIGESGCGKTTLNLALIRQLPKTASTFGDGIFYTYRDGRQINVLELNDRDMRRFLWSECAMVFQGALNSLNPVIRVRDVVFETARAHGMKREEAYKRALKLLEQVRLDAERVMRSYPHELSGGMRQRVLLALSLILRPQVVIMDEPTTAVDILTQRSILDVLKQLRDELNFSVIFISHDLAVAAEIADTVATMYAGEIVERGPVNEVFYRSRHAYTLNLLNAAPRLSVGVERLESIAGKPPDLIEPPTGCKFHERCSFATAVCAQVQPPLVEYEGGHLAACHETGRVLIEARETRLVSAP